MAAKFHSWVYWRLTPAWLRLQRDKITFSRNHLKASGWSLSRSLGQSVDSESSEIPWITYAATDFLSSLTFTEYEVLEFGGGSSSLWWAKRCRKLTVIEHNEEWFQILLEKLGDCTNVSVYKASSESGYVEFVDIRNPDVIVIDGEFRDRIMDQIEKKFVGQLLPLPKVIIIDNSDRMPVRVTDFCRNLNYLKIDFPGMSPINTYSSTTTIAIRWH
jgi:hypothetical protein